MSSRGSARHRLELSARVALAWRPTGPRLLALLRSLVVSFVALGLTLYLVPGRQSSGPLAVLGLVIAVAVAGLLLRPLLAGLAAVLGSFGLLLLGVVSQAIILDVAIALAPNLDIGGQPEVLVISWVAASVAAIVNWLLDAGSEDAYLNQLLGRAVRSAQLLRRVGDTGPGRLLVVQFDGVGAGSLRTAMSAGSLPTIAHWLQSRTHELNGWHTGLPATTPAAQAVLLHGDTSEVPSFRWFEKETGQLVVANHPRDAAEIERRISNGAGLLAEGGVSVSNLFSGDAPIRFLTMSDARLPSRETHALVSFATARGGLARCVVLAVGTVLTELYQGGRQRWRDVRPRVHRGGVFALQRAVTTVLLRDVTISIVAEQIAQGASAIFVDFIDFDEVAHHAGPSRPESVRTLARLDRLVGFFADVSRETGQGYEIAIVSDHGQSQGATFAQRSGVTLAELVATLSAGSGTAAIDSDREELPGPTDRGVIVAAAGSLAHIYLPELPGRATREDIDRLFPRLVDGLTQHPQIGAVMVRSAALGAVLAVGARGWRELTAVGPVGGDGIDPVAEFGPLACADLLALDGRRHVGDIVVLARVDAQTDEVAAFEDLVGSHGGLGGGQTEAFFLHPADWQLPSGSPLHGIDVHRVLQAHASGHVPAPVAVDERSREEELTDERSREEELSDERSREEEMS